MEKRTVVVEIECTDKHCEDGEDECPYLDGMGGCDLFDQDLGEEEQTCSHCGSVGYGESWSLRCNLCIEAECDVK